MSAFLQRFKIYDLGLKIFLFFGFFIILSSLIINPVLAKTSTPSAIPTEATTSAQIATNSADVNYQPLGYVSPQSPQYANLMVNNLLHAFSCLMVGQSTIGQPCVDYLNGVPVISSINKGGGLLGSAINLNTFVIANPPIRTGQYLATIGYSLGLVKEAHAQVSGSGAGVLDPIINLWQVSRNIAYVVMIIIFVVVGLMVMFRQKINPQTVISIQAALPGLVIGLIMITFSYFLASLLVDTAYLATNLVGYYFTAAQNAPSSNLTQDISDKSVLFIFGKFVGSIGQEDIAKALNLALSSLNDNIQSMLRLAAGLIGYQYGSSFGTPTGSLVGSAVCLPVTGPIAAFCGAIGGIVGGLVIGIPLALKAASDPAGTFSWILYIVAAAVLLYTMLRLLLKLINNYLQIIFLTVTAPFQFMIASLPGRQGIMIDWIRNMLCNVLAFPAVLAVFYFAAYLLGSPRDPFIITGSLSISNNQALPLFGGLDISFIKILLAFGALTATPAIPDIICQAIGKVGRAGALIGQQIEGGTRGGQGYVGRVQGAVGGANSTLSRTFETLSGRPQGTLRGAINEATGQAPQGTGNGGASGTRASRS